MKKILAIGFILLLISSMGLASEKFSSFSDIANKLSGKITIGLSNNIAILDLNEENIYYLSYGKINAHMPTWGPKENTITYFHHKNKNPHILDKNDTGDIKIINLDNSENIFIPDIPIMGFGGFAWSNDKKQFTYIDTGNLNLLTNAKEKLLSINLLASSPQKLLHAENPIFSKDNKNIFFIGRIDDGDYPYPTAIYVLNIKDKSIQTIKKEPCNICSIAASPIKKEIAYTSDKGLFIINLENNLEQRVLKLPELLYNFCCWSPDGTKILYGYPRPWSSYMNLTGPALNIHMVDKNTKEETILITKQLLQNEINIEKPDLICRSVDWID